LLADLENTINKCKSRWLIGGSAVKDISSPEWQEIIGSGNDAELKLLSLVGHSVRTSLILSPPSEPQFHDILPKLDLPTLDDQTRVLFRQVLNNNKSSTVERELILLIANRGRVPHPLDWIPKSASMALPPVFTPWLNWIETGQQQEILDELTSENWDQHMPAERRDFLRHMRFHEPKKALQLISENAANEPADKRLQVIETLEVNLGDNDMEYLQSLSSDRASKIRTLALKFLARLNKIETAPEDLKELIDYLEVKKVSNKKAKTTAQKKKRNELFNTISLTALAEAIGFSTDDLIKKWVPNKSDYEATEDFINMIINTGSDSQVDLFVSVAQSKKGYKLSSLEPLVPRLKDTVKIDLASTALLQKGGANEASSMHLARKFLGDNIGVLPYKSIKKSPEYKEVLKMAKESEKYHLDELMIKLSFLVDADAAKEILTDFEKNGLMKIDPRLIFLRINEAVLG